MHSIYTHLLIAARLMWPAAERHLVTTQLLYSAPPRGAQSKSIQVAQTYLDTLTAMSSALKIDVRPLRENELPEFNGDKAAAEGNAMVRRKQNAAQQTGCRQGVQIATRLIAGDRHFFAVTLWNGMVP